MLTFRPITAKDFLILRPYYEHCTYRLCEYSVGVKYMWQHSLHSEYTIVEDCLIIRNTIHGNVMYDFPIPGPNGSVEKGLLAVEDHCREIGQRPVFSIVPESQGCRMAMRYAKVSITNEWSWRDYIYLSQDLAKFEGRRYSGQRNHINKFRKNHEGAEFLPLTAEHKDLIEQFWVDYEAEFAKDSDGAKKELEVAKDLFTYLDTGIFRAGGILYEGKLIAIALAEKCGDTLVCHIEKALYSHAGVYPTMVQAFAGYYADDCLWINREDDGQDKGLRTSKMQYLPSERAGKLCFAVGNELDSLEELPQLTTARLTLSAFTEEDKAAYNALCLDDERNRYWGYDYRKDLQGELTEDYFLDVAKKDFDARLAANFAIRLDGKCIGEAVLYNGDWRGGMELGCRIAPEYAGNGYGAEAFAAVAEWGLYKLGLLKVVAKCYRENEPSFKMLSSCMRKVSEDEKFFYFEKLI